MRVATNLIWFPVADGGNADYVLVKELGMANLRGLKGLHGSEWVKWVRLG